MPKRKRFTVRGTRGAWEIAGPHGFWSRRRKRDAIAFGRRIARKQPLAQLVVFRMDGTIEFENTYGKDPRPRSGRYRG